MGPQNYLEPTHFNDADPGKNRFTWKIILTVKLTQIKYIFISAKLVKGLRLLTKDI